MREAEGDEASEDGEKGTFTQKSLTFSCALEGRFRSLLYCGEQNAVEVRRPGLRHALQVAVRLRSGVRVRACHKGLGFTSIFDNGGNFTCEEEEEEEEEKVFSNRYVRERIRD